VQSLDERAIAAELDQMELTNSEPVACLIALGPPKSRGWCNYASLGITTEHSSELFRVLETPEVEVQSAEDPELWAPMHAWRALAQLGTLDLVGHLLKRLDEFTDDNWDDYLLSDFSQAMSLIGSAALDPLIEWLNDARHVGFSAWPVAGGIAAVAREHPELRGRALAVLEAELRNWRDRSSEHNAGLVSALIDIRARESIPLIREAMNAEAVDEMVVGTLEQVEVELGVHDRPLEPRFGQLSISSSLSGRGDCDLRAAINAKERARARRKAAKASKNRNRKR
jgi:hypothetical protein